MNWQELEAHVRLIASCKWAAAANPEHVNGVNVDCVLKPSSDRWILIEITREVTLDKLRGDLAKFATVRPYLFSNNVYAECYFVCEDEPPPSLVGTGSGVNVRVLSATGFERLLIDYPAYKHLRMQKRFGSAVDPESGSSDPRAYVAVRYIGVSHERTYSIADIDSLLRQGRRMILIGNYGTGKSRCVKELF